MENIEIYNQIDFTDPNSMLDAVAKIKCDKCGESPVVGIVRDIGEKFNFKTQMKERFPLSPMQFLCEKHIRDSIVIGGLGSLYE